MYGLHREHQGVSDGALDGGAGGILDDGVGNHVLVVVLIRKLIGAKFNGIFHKQVLRIDMHHQSVAIEHVDGMATGLADFTVDRTMLICRLIKLGGIVAVPLQDFIGVDIGTDAVPLGNHFNRHTCGSAQTDEAAGRNGIHVCGERRVTHHVVTHTRTVQKHGGGTEVAHIVNRSHCPTAVRTVVQFDCDTTHDILVLGSVHVNLEGIQCMQRTGDSGECGLGGRHNPVNNIDVDSVSAQIGSRSVDGVTPTVDGVDHRVTTDTVESEHGLQYGALKHQQRDIGHTADIQETACSRHLADNAVLGNLHRAVRSQVGHRNTVTQDFITDGSVHIFVVTGRDINVIHLLDGCRNCDIRIARLRSDSDNRNIRSLNDMDNQGIAGDDDGRHTLRTCIQETNRINTCKCRIRGIPEIQIEDNLVFTRLLEVGVDVHNGRIENAEPDVIKTIASARNPSVGTHRNVTVERNVAEVDIGNVDTQITIDTVEHLVIDGCVIVVHAVEHCTIIKQIVVGNQTQVEILIDVGRIAE